MICPYNVKRIEQVNQNEYENEDGMTKIHTHKLIEIKTFMECAGVECGAYDRLNDRCDYRGAFE